MNRWPRLGVAVGLLALLGLWLVTYRAERRLEDETNAYLARSAANYFRVTVPSDGFGGLDAGRLLSTANALAISSFWPGGLQGALGTRPLLPDTLNLAPLPIAVEDRVLEGLTVSHTSHGRRRAAVAPLFDRDEWSVLGWTAVWRSLGRPRPSGLSDGLLGLAALFLLSLVWVPVRAPRVLTPGRRALVAAGLTLLATASLALDIQQTGRQATETRLLTSEKLIEVAATADGVRRSRLPEIAVDAVVSPASRTPDAATDVEYLDEAGLRWARVFASTPRGGDNTTIEIRLESSLSGFGFTWTGLGGLAVFAFLGLGFAAWSAGAATRTREFRSTVAAWGFMLPALGHLVLFSFVPVGFTVYLAFHRWDLLSRARPFVGLANFESVLGEGRFAHSLWITALYSLHVPLTMAVALAAALALDRSGLRVRLLRTILFMPAVSSVVAVALVWQWLYHPDAGWLNAALRGFGVEGPDWLGDPRTALPALMAMAVWAQLGYQMVVFLGGLQSIPSTYLDAARVDGASPVRRFWHVTLPLLRPTTLFVLVTSLISSFQVFTYVAVMTDGGPLRATDVAVYRIYQEAWEFLRFGTASAMSLLLLAVLLVVTWVCFRWLGRRVELV